MQLTIRMPDKHYFSIEKIAKQMGLKKSDVARMAIHKYVNDNEIREEMSPYEKAKHLLGIAESGVIDLGQNHRRHLIKKISRYTDCKKTSHSSYIRSKERLSPITSPHLHTKQGLVELI